MSIFYNPIEKNENINALISDGCRENNAHTQYSSTIIDDWFYHISIKKEKYKY